MVIIRPALTNTLLKACVAVCGFGVVPSVTVTENEYVPTAVGVPLIVPFELRVSPAGKAPAVTVQVYGLFHSRRSRRRNKIGR